MMFQARNYRLLVFYEQIASCRERVQYVRGDGINGPKKYMKLNVNTD